MTHEARHISLAIECPPGKIYDFVTNPVNLPQWASGLSKAEIKAEGDHWITDSPMGRVKIKFAEKNNFGVMDHNVTLPEGPVVKNPFRVLASGTGSEVIFTLLRRPGVSEAEFNGDQNHIEKDLRKLKSLLENLT